MNVQEGIRDNETPIPCRRPSLVSLCLVNMYNLNDSAKMQRDWSISDDGKSRSIVAKDDAGKVQFTRDSDIVFLTADEFTYRVFPDPERTDVYFDIVHSPTDHAEPAVS